MSFDQQVRSGLIANSAQLNPDTEGALSTVLGRARRRRRARQTGVALVAAVTALVAYLWLPSQLHVVRTPIGPAAPEDSAPAIQVGRATASSTSTAYRQHVTGSPL